MEIAAVFLPLIAAAIAGFGRHIVGARGAEIITTAALCICAALAVMLFYQYAALGQTAMIPVSEFIHSGNLQLPWALRFDVLTAVMVLVVTAVSAMVHLYSIGYMHEDPSRAKFMAYLSLFTFFMLMLVTADNFVQLFFGWEGVGLASYLLIGFYNHKPSANDAAIKAFIVNRVGDFGFALGIFTVFALFGSLQFSDVFNAVGHMGAARIFTVFGVPFDAVTLACVLLFIGAVGKSAQLGLHTWLPDAMEGPTPVSALIHAATMVTAGVFMLVRISPLLDAAPVARNIIVIVGALTAFVGAAIAFGQFDIKKVIAYSTMSQLGYMVFAAGATAYGGAIFHLFTHAFFKALLFLGAGSVIHAMHHEQDMRHYGGLYKKLPITYALMWIGTLALMGVPFFAGYFSKDMILEAEWAGGNGFDMFAYVIGVLVAFMTATYSSKVMFMTFHGRPKYDLHHAHDIHEAPLTMLIPLFVLAAGAVLSGWLAYDYFVGPHHALFWEPIMTPKSEVILDAAEHDPLWVKLVPTLAALLGLLLGWVCYVKETDLPAWFAKTFPLANRIIDNKFYFDKVYSAVFADGSMQVGKLLWRYGDIGIIDRFGPDGGARASGFLGARLSKLQTGYLYHYAFVMLMALVLLIAWLLFGSSAAHAEQSSLSPGKNTEPQQTYYLLASHGICCSGAEQYRVAKSHANPEQFYVLSQLYGFALGRPTELESTYLSKGFPPEILNHFKETLHPADLIFLKNYITKTLSYDTSKIIDRLVDLSDQEEKLNRTAAEFIAKNNCKPEDNCLEMFRMYKNNYINGYLEEPPLPEGADTILKSLKGITDKKFKALLPLSQEFGVYSCGAIVGDDNWSCYDLADNKKWEEPLPDDININKSDLHEPGKK